MAWHSPSQVRGSPATTMGADVTGGERRRRLEAAAGEYARVALANVTREYPHHEPHLQTRPAPIPPPHVLHPAFYGSFDWHSCVEMHWLLVRLLRLTPDQVHQAEIREVLDRHLAAGPLAAEAAFFADPDHRTSERPYGWGWALTLAAEAGAWRDAGAQRWAGNLRPLADVLVVRFLDWLPRATYPQRSGLHGNSAFGLSLALPFARRLAADGAPALLDGIVRTAHRWFDRDEDYPGAWEPSGSDFLSPALVEAELMAGVLDPTAFAAWLGRFLPDIAGGRPAALFTPAEVSDSTDGQIAHLHGLNLSRAWCWRRLAETLPEGDPRIVPMLAAVRDHADAALGQATGSDYAIEHWLAVYAVLLLT